MDREFPKEDTGKIELERILNCLKQNNYEFRHLSETNMYGHMIANFKKYISYSDKNGNCINDHYIKIKIEFSTDYDYKNNYNDDNDEFIFDIVKGENFIQNLMTSTYDNNTSK